MRPCSDCRTLESVRRCRGLVQKRLSLLNLCCNALWGHPARHCSGPSNMCTVLVDYSVSVFPIIVKSSILVSDKPSESWICNSDRPSRIIFSSSYQCQKKLAVFGLKSCSVFNSSFFIWLCVCQCVHIHPFNFSNCLFLFWVKEVCVLYVGVFHTNVCINMKNYSRWLIQAKQTGIINQ